jgi:hypothetical protein
MTYRGPQTNDRSSRRRTFIDRSYDGYRGNTAIVGTIVAMAGVMTILAYGLSRTPTRTATGPSSTISDQARRAKAAAHPQPARIEPSHRQQPTKLEPVINGEGPRGRCASDAPRKG